MKKALLIFTLLFASVSAAEDDENFNIEIQAGTIWQTYNDIQIPNDLTGTRFALEDVIGTGPFGAIRITAGWKLSEDKELELVLAPFKAEESGSLDSPIFYNDVRFDAGSVKATYKFNTHRLTYRYTFYESDYWTLKIGATGLIRDADVIIEQGNTRTNYDNLGFVPLLNFKSRYNISDSFKFIFDFNGLAGGPGRLLEGDFRFQYTFDEKLVVGLGYRFLEGGVGIEDVYNFALLNTSYISLGYRF